MAVCTKIGLGGEGEGGRGIYIERLSSDKIQFVYKLHLGLCPIIAGIHRIVGLGYFFLIQGVEGASAPPPPP